VKDSKDYEYKPRQIPDMSDRAFRFGEGKISGALACLLGVLSFLGVLCYKYPAYLTVMELRAGYDHEMLRIVLMVCMWASLGFGLLTFILGKQRRLGAIGVLFTVAAFALGGHSVEAGEAFPNKLSLGLDWLILSLLASVVLFTFFEKIFPKYREQAILRPEWQLDLFYFSFNHLIFAIILLIGNYFVSTVFGWAANADLQAFVQNLPIVVQVLILIICADFVLYWSHRMFHENPRLWRIHAVHHSVEHMDWLAGSRNHVVQTFVDRCIAMVPLYLIGPDKAALDIYVIIAGIQSVFVHANIGIPFGPLKYIICTPQYHHWHHSSEAPAIDTNYAVHMPLFDMIFGTYHMPDKHWPAHYGTTSPLPRSFWGQLFYPFKKE
jgi:sterol desaturase/sphingolipid hydroxylase (fatty acid hydroxylase superfamily)